MKDVYIARICYPVLSLGPGRRMAIWFAGCSNNCSECISPEFKAHNPKQRFGIRQLCDFIALRKKEIEGFTISGGEPFDQLDGLIELINNIRYISDDIIIFSGYKFMEIQNKFGNKADIVFSNISVLVDGPYIKDLHVDKGLRGSSNQDFIVFDDRYSVENLISFQRSMQTYFYANRYIEIGIP